MVFRVKNYVFFRKKQTNSRGHKTWCILLYLSSAHSRRTYTHASSRANTHTHSFRTRPVNNTTTPAAFQNELVDGSSWMINSQKEKPPSRQRTCGTDGPLCGSAPAKVTPLPTRACHPPCVTSSCPTWNTIITTIYNRPLDGFGAHLRCRTEPNDVITKHAS